MSTRNHPNTPRASSLAADEEALWRHVTKDVKPVRGTPRVPPAKDRQEQALERRLTVGKHPARPELPLSRPRAERVAPAPAPIDRRDARRIAAGRIKIDATIDLHGLRQAEAHAALRRFLARCRSQGHRTVLVVTGKGGSQRESEPSRGMPAPNDRGVLRRNVPRWLAEPELSATVIGFTTAHTRHGGDGALYVTLRRR
ncbi:MAG TPA: Smr/MutS family protein [Hyphomicrobiaceae bacterium]|nr:Smr/MutS family protein [Hyphomicrobiaceae bacterium]